MSRVPCPVDAHVVPLIDSHTVYGTRWWPWAYEVLVVQWTEVLAAAEAATKGANSIGGTRMARALDNDYPFSKDTLPGHTT